LTDKRVGGRIEIGMADETDIASYKHQFLSRPLCFQISEAISIKDGVIDGVEVKGGEVGERLDGVTKVEMSMGEGHSTPFGSGQDSSGLGAGGEQSTSDAQVKVKTYVVVSGVMQRSLPVQVGDRVVTLNGQAVSSWSFWELADKLKHLPLPLTLEFIRTSQYVTVLQVPPSLPSLPQSWQPIYPSLCFDGHVVSLFRSMVHVP
jgi:hypothetical protein